MESTSQNELLLPFQLTPAQQIIDMLKTIKQEHLSNDPAKSKVMQLRIDYAIEKIGQRNIFDVDIIDQLDLATTKK